MTFSEIDLELFTLARTMMQTEAPKAIAYYSDAKLIWAGKHYLLIRTGPSNGVCHAELWSRERLLLRLGNKSGNPMVEIALATIHPVNRYWADNDRRGLHRSGGKSGGIAKFVGRRWCKALVQDLIGLAEEEDTLFHEKEHKEIARRNARDHFANEVAQLAISAGLEVKCDRPKHSEAAFPAGCVCKANGAASADALWRVLIWRVSGPWVQVWSEKHFLSKAEFEVLVQAYAKIDSMRAAQKVV